MKIVLTGGGTGGHFYPLIAITESLRNFASNDHLASLEVYYYSDEAYDEKALQAQRVHYVFIPSGKLGLSYSLFQKIASIFQATRGVCVALWELFWLYPDVVMSKGGYASVPTSVAAWILGIPLCVHESDLAPGRSTLFLSRFAKYVFVSYKAAGQFFPEKKVIHSGQPVRHALLYPASNGARELLLLEPDLPVLWIVGGSSGAQKFNTLVLALMPDILYQVQIVHQTGKQNYDAIVKESSLILQNHSQKNHYHPLAFMDEITMRRLAGVADLIITRAGSALFEIAAWGTPAIVVPFAVSNSDHSRKNAYIYAEHNAASVIEEDNLTPEIVRTEILRIINDKSVQSSMRAGAASFATKDAANVIAYKLMQIGYEHTPLPEIPEIPLSLSIEDQLTKNASGK
jgi:UDP-N-acetylglucosamine--N-acetylmuramyl-(pentapeptide) pyrophosphoryl-undecaprenol N-acetylglucosamine transferase